jgi:hypothetical protein
VSRRRARRQDPAAGAKAPRGEHAPRRQPPAARGLARDVAILIAVFAAATGIAELAGAANLGVAIGVGQVAFAIALVWVLTRG